MPKKIRKAIAGRTFHEPFAESYQFINFSNIEPDFGSFQPLGLSRFGLNLEMRLRDILLPESVAKLKLEGVPVVEGIHNH